MFDNGSVTYTDSEEMPWWFVDLEVTVANDPDFLSPVWTASSPGTHDEQVYYGLFDVGTTGRYVRLQIDSLDEESLQLTEVQIYGTGGQPWLQPGEAPQQGANIALSAAAWQNSDAGSSYWTVDLGADVRLDSLEIYNPTDSTKERLSGVKVTVAADGIPEPDSAVLTEFDNPLLTEESPGTLADPVYHGVLGGIRGRYLRIQSSTTTADYFLNLAKVKIYGEEPPQEPDTQLTPPPPAVPSEDAAALAPVFDFDDDACLPAPGFGTNGSQNDGDGVDWRGDSNYGSCRAMLDSANTYHRHACVFHDSTRYCGHFYSLYFEKDPTGVHSWVPVDNSEGHKHDWEYAAVWTTDGAPTHGSVSKHGDLRTRPWTSVPVDSEGHMKVVYFKDSEYLGTIPSTHAFRFAHEGEVSATNPTGQWTTPALLSWYEMEGGLSNAELRVQVNSFDYGSATLPIKDGEFYRNLDEFKPTGYPSFSEGLLAEYKFPFWGHGEFVETSDADCSITHSQVFAFITDMSSVCRNSIIKSLDEEPIFDKNWSYSFGLMATRLVGDGDRTLFTVGVHSEGGAQGRSVRLGFNKSSVFLAGPGGGRLIDIHSFEKNQSYLYKVEKVGDVVNVYVNGAAVGTVDYSDLPFGTGARFGFFNRQRGASTVRLLSLKLEKL